MTACIHYDVESYTAAGPRLMGRNAAGESFLRGFLAHTKATQFWAQVHQPAHAQFFAETVKASGRTEPVKVVDRGNLAALAQPGVLYCPGPGIGHHAFRRAALGSAAWSLCGITHTTASAPAMDALVELIAAPVQPWDALICTSTAVRNNVERVLQAQVDYLADRLGISKVVLPQLPVIPLGIHTADFSFDDQHKADARRSMGVDEHTLAVLFMGRLSFHGKAHPLAMYQALESAAASTGKQVVLIECGWHANDFIANAYREAARLACPSVRVITLDGRIAENRRTAWAAADVFCSLSDNIQESFGIAPLEAMAAGIPVVVSDWDGYRDTVRDGIDGLRIPTLMPEAGLGSDLALRHALEVDTYDMYCGHACSLIAVDVETATRALARLFAAPELRRQLGAAGRQRARQVYDWRVIIPEYEALWAQQNERRKAQAKDSKALAHPWPARMDPLHAFAAYPTRTLEPQTLLGLVDCDAASASRRVEVYRQCAMVKFAEAVLPSAQEVRAVLEAAAHGPRSAADLIDAIPLERQAFVFRALAWLLKLGVLKLHS